MKTYKVSKVPIPNEIWNAKWYKHVHVGSSLFFFFVFDLLMVTSKYSEHVCIFLNTTALHKIDHGWQYIIQVMKIKPHMQMTGTHINRMLQVLC